MTEPLKIGFDAKRAFLNSTGLGSYSRNTIHALNTYYPHNDYYLFTPSVNPEIYEPPKPLVTVAPEGQWWKSVKPVWRTYKVTELAQKSGLDIFHGLSHELPVGLEKAGIRSVVTFHDLIVMRYPRFYRAADRRFYYRKYKHAVKVADKIIAISQQTKLDLVEYLKVDESRIELLYQCVNPMFFERSRPEDLEFTRVKYRLPHQFILIPGTIEKRKNQDQVLRAIAENEIDFPIVLVGKQTPFFKSLKPYLKQLEGRIMFLTEVSNQELSHIYQMAYLSIFVSLFEGFGLPVVEAQASGCPVLTSNVSSMPEAGGKAALYVNPEKVDEIADGIKLLLSDTKMREERISLGYENAERFRSEQYARGLMEIYQKL
ncbi:glycosyltransferase family 4 protein [Mangrovibacterium lignilyticum]|uniref:glycosyltransferase family 4 protein n=1 Tax=Mangrovibacterium lignilyticum TaxID=2668052 RepID=UPI0013D5700F|nr:glycosyltransferase family 1 protein [Mangrovibacterium lignilyticum]